jgi:NAD(P)-dependent dehydrogenase (short-subunit alcohol dehydrogenase family)
MHKNILIVGASTGIGEEMTKLFALNKANTVLAISRNVESNTDFEKLDNVICKNIDLESTKLKTDLHQFLDSFQSIDYVVFNAGKLINRPFLELTEEEILSSYKVNVLSAFTVFQVVIPKMKNPNSHVVTISSMGAFQGSVKFSGLSSYSSSKAALTNLTEMLAEEFNNSNISFNCLCLGAAQTTMLEQAFPGYQAPVSASKMAEFIVDFTLKANQWLNGKIIPVSLSTP